MKQLLILSGKGGTGKTTIAASFIKLSKDRAFADCDVDAPNLHLLFDELKQIEKNDYMGYKKAVLYKDECLNCGLCENLCRFDAISNMEVNPYRCEGCGVCEYFCKAAENGNKAAIRLEDNTTGYTFLSLYEDTIFSHAELKMGYGASGKLVTEVRKQLYEKAADEELIIIDGSPGIGCPVSASITGTDMVLAVTEPGLSGLHDLDRLVKTARRLDTECVVCINKYDLNEKITEDIFSYCKESNIPILGKVPYDPEVVKEVNKGKSIIDLMDSPAAQEIRNLYNNVITRLFNN